MTYNVEIENLVRYIRELESHHLSLREALMKIVQPTITHVAGAAKAQS